MAVTETVGGALLIAGLATALVAASPAVHMLVALLTARLGHGFFARDGGFELELLLAGAGVAIGIVGAGGFSLDASLELLQRVSQRASGVIGQYMLGAKGNASRRRSLSSRTSRDHGGRTRRPEPAAGR